MADDICQRFVDGENYGMAFQFGKSQRRRELSQDISYNTEHLRITPQFHSQQQTARAHARAPSRSPNLDLTRTRGRQVISMDPFSNLMFFWGQPADATTAPMIHAISPAATRKPTPGLSTRLKCLSHGFM
jgi:hypothetical protein